MIYKYFQLCWTVFKIFMPKVGGYGIFANFREFSKLWRPITHQIMGLRSSSFFHSIQNFIMNKNAVQMLSAMLSCSWDIHAQSVSGYAIFANFAHLFFIAFSPMTSRVSHLCLFIAFSHMTSHVKSRFTLVFFYCIFTHDKSRFTLVFFIHPWQVAFHTCVFYWNGGVPP